jgi:hypothetical protein
LLTFTIAAIEEFVVRHLVKRISTERVEMNVSCILSGEFLVDKAINGAHCDEINLGLDTLPLPVEPGVRPG